MTEKQNGERTVRCPLEGCNRELLARGVNLHIRQSSDNIHGPQGEVPEDVNLDEMETVGAKSVNVDYPEERNDDTNYVLCPFCYEIFKGQRGMKTHLSQKSGQGQHPDDATEQSELEKATLSKEVRTNETEFFADRVRKYINYLLAEGEIEEAKRAKRFLLGWRE